ncbi:MAG: mechanosensitive ion channel [Bacteroidaceae bacterium]|nr:mechanosensitive ion channel [Bacteroidaceae bacterium]
MINLLTVVDTLAVNEAVNVPEAISGIASLTVSDIYDAVTSFALTFTIKLVQIALIWYVGRWLGRRLINIVKAVMDRRGGNETVRGFLLSLIDVVVMLVLLIIIIGVIGIDTSSFIALFASAGVAVGMALSGTLQNFAGGVIILLFRPFKVGDFIEAQGVSGTVKEIQIFNTLVHTGDNKVILLPNGPVSTGIINNYSREPKRRLDFTFSIAYGDDYEKAKEVLLRLIKEDSRVLDNPAAPFVALSALGASSIDITVRVWCKQEDYWGIKFDLNKKVYEIFPKEGLNFPYQTLTLHVEKDA